MVKTLQDNEKSSGSIFKLWKNNNDGTSTGLATLCVKLLCQLQSWSWSQWSTPNSKFKAIIRKQKKSKKPKKSKIKSNQIFLSYQLTWCKYNFSQIPDFTINFTHIFFFLFLFLVYTQQKKIKNHSNLHLCLKKSQLCNK